jgi:hypothetical protein
MIYVMQSAAPGERIVHLGRFHPLYTFAAVINVVLGVIFGVAVYVAAIYGQMQMGLPLSIRKWDLDDSWLSIIFKLHPAVHFIAGAFVLIGAYKCLYMLVARATTEIAITTERVVYKHGLVARYVGEMNIERIEGGECVPKLSRPYARFRPGCDTWDGRRANCITPDCQSDKISARD